MSVARGVNKEGHHASIPNHHCPPPRRSVEPVPSFRASSGSTLTVESRERILGTLSRIVAQQLALPPALQEATNERH